MSNGNACFTLKFHLFLLQTAQSMQSLHNVNFDNYGYTVGGSAFQDLMNTQRSVPNVNNMGDQGLSPPYSNQSPPYSVQSNMALSPQAYIGKSPELFNSLKGSFATIY